MKKFCLCLFALSPFVGNFWDYNTVEVMASKPVASYTCEVTMVPEKEDLQKVIKILQTLTGTKEIE